MKMMDNSSADDDCAIEVVTPAKKKKMKQARLSFQTLSASKSSHSTKEVPSKKRKVMSPLEGYKSAKTIKYTPEKRHFGSISKEKLSDSNRSIQISDEEGEEGFSKQSEEQNREIGKMDTMPKQCTLGKSKRSKLDKSKEKPGTLTKFLKEVDKTAVNDISRDNSLDSKCTEDQNSSLISEEKNEICDKNSDAKSIEFTQCIFQVDKKLEYTNVDNKDAESYCQESDSDNVILLSDDEISSELNKSVTNENKRKTSKPVVSTPSRNDKKVKKRLKELTQKQLEKEQEIKRRKEEKVKLKMEKEKKREEEKANKTRKREEKQRKKEEKERMEKEEKKKEKELKELKKQMEIEEKKKEKEAKEEERKKREEIKEEEKRRKEEERLEAERKKQKAASNFASFFVPKKQNVKSMEKESVEAKNFMPFEIKADMRIAPVCRRTLDDCEKLLLDKNCNMQVNTGKSELYLENIKKKRFVPRTFSKTWPLETKDDIILLDEESDGNQNMITETYNLERHRPKLLQFKDNRRPAYWGTWRKQSNIINPRRPFAKDEKWFDYEVDSDDEWEEEEPGESLKGSDDEKEQENLEENEYDVDNEFMVPHGYLSDEEAQADEEEMEDMSPQTQKMKLKLLGEQFEAERNVKTHKLNPRIIGCIWQGSDNSFPKSVSTKVQEFLLARQAWVSHVPIILPSMASENDIAVGAECKTTTKQQSGRGTKKTRKFPDEALPYLIRLLHGNTYGRHFLMKEFMTFWNRNDKAASHQLSKSSVLQKINELANKIACPEEGPMHLKSCWYVPEEIRKQYLPQDDLTLPNRWTYILMRKSEVSKATEDTDKTEKEKKEKEKEKDKEREKEKRNAPLITQFTKKITQEEMKRQLTTKPDQILSIPSKLSPLQKLPKRATLISVGRGEQFPENSRENILAKFVGLKKTEEEPLSNEEMITDSNNVIFVESIKRDGKNK